MRDMARELAQVGHTTEDPAAQAAVKRAVLLHWDRSDRSKAEAEITREALEMLGLLPYEDGGQYTPTGRLQNRGRARSDQPAGEVAS